MATPESIIQGAQNLPISSRQVVSLPANVLPPQAKNTIRNISQTVQEREIIKTAPDIVVFFEGLPYILNYYVNDPRNGATPTLVNFNDHITGFSATYDTDSMIPNCTINLQVPNFQKYLYFMPGGNNLLATMAQIQVYAKSYWLSSTGDTVYRRVFKGVSSNIGYNDNGKTLEISMQCQGILYLLEKMQVNIHPSANTAHHTGGSQTVFQSKYASFDCFQIIGQAFLDALRSDMFQISQLQSAFMNTTNPFYDSISRGFMNKWQAILYNMVRDVHVYGPDKDSLGDVVKLKRGAEWNAAGKALSAASMAKRQTQTDSQITENNLPYYANIQVTQPFRNVWALDLKNNVIVNRLDLIREVVRMIDFEAYQDIDGKIIVKPPLYNLDVTNLGTRTQSTSTLPGSSHNSYTNTLTALYPTNNPFVVYLSEILTEQETEDQSAIRRTRTTVTGNAYRHLGNNYDDFLKPVAEWIDIAKMAKFGLREEPTYQVPWLGLNQLPALFAHAAAETARANRGYRTYTFTIPMRPELKLGFPVFIPHRDMYCYIKNISCNYSVGGTATMTVSCDTVRRRVLVNTWQTSGSGNSQNSFQAYTPAPNLVLQWTSSKAQQEAQKSTTPTATAQNNATATHIAQGGNAGVSNNPPNISNLVGTSYTQTIPDRNPDGSSPAPSDDQLKLWSVKTQSGAAKLGNQYSTPYATYVMKNDGNQQQGTIDPKTKRGYFTYQRSADLAYMQAIIGNATTKANSVIPYTDDKGYEVVAPFPWGRWQDLNSAIKEFTEQGWITKNRNLVGDLTQDLADLQTLKNSDAFLFAGLGTPTTQNDPSTQLLAALNQNISTVGGSTLLTTSPNSGATSTDGTSSTNESPKTVNAYQKSVPTPDATVIVLQYDTSNPSMTATNQLLNAMQPENAFAAKLLANSQNSQQQLVNVLVSGTVAPTPFVQEQLLATMTPQPNPTNSALLRAIALNRTPQQVPTIASTVEVPDQIV